ncbi:unnamed protein product [Cuscuta campestris]|uniref:PHD finger protein ALFIN-LIKE n=1 Tax=Cuscuta campestris TaxID=132261 RepID=A0A484LX91_9ASTE|nr:unnamed protein product [Cuscuta campestris]VFQ90637.1 unnamed protein product [Cuscuta campestris]
MASCPPNPRSVEDIFKNFSARRTAVIHALTRDVDEFFSQCDPEKDNLCLYGHADESWEVTLPAEDVPPEIPEPVLGINFARDGMDKRDWLTLVAMHTDSWLLSVAFYFGARLNRYERNRLFSLINDLPTVYEIATGRRSKERLSADEGKKFTTNTKREKPGRRVQESYEEEENEEEDEGEDQEDESNTVCGTCGVYYNKHEFWIGCDVCERWFHGKCVKITPAKAESIKFYKCPYCCNKRSKQ